MRVAGLVLLCGCAPGASSVCEAVLDDATQNPSAYKATEAPRLTGPEIACSDEGGGVALVLATYRYRLGAGFTVRAATWTWRVTTSDGRVVERVLVDDPEDSGQ